MAKQKVFSSITKDNKLDKRTTSGRIASGRDINSETLSKKVLKGKK